MNEITRVLGIAKQRLFLIDLLRTLAVTLFIAVVLMVAARITQKLVPVFEFPWMLSALIAVGVAFGAAVVWALLRRPSLLKVAQEVDERAELRESLSTALCVDDTDDAWSKTIVDDAAHQAQRVVMRDALPIAAPRLWPMPFAAGLALLAVWFLPSTDVTGLLAEKEQRLAQEAQVREVQAKVADINQQMADIAKSADLDLESLGDESGEDLLSPDRIEQAKPEEIVRATLKKLTTLKDQLEEKRNDEDGATFDAIKDAMRNLNAPEPGAASEMGRAMARGDFKEAQEKLSELADQIQNGEMSESDKKQAAAQLEKMKQQLEKLAENTQQLEEQLQAAGLSEQQAKQLSGDPEAMKKALEELGNMSQEQIQELANKAQGQQNASDAASAMAEAMGQMAQGMQNGDMQQASEGMESMSGQLSGMEQMQQEMQALEQAMSQCEGQMAGLGQGQGGGSQTFGEGSEWGQTGEFAQGDSTTGMGSGSGGGGQGNGASPDQQAVDYTVKKEHANVNTTGDGPVISSTFVNGEQVRGESRAQFSEVVTSATTQAAQAIETKRVPHEHEAAVKRYFGRLERKAKEASGETSPGEAGSDADKPKESKPEGD